MHARTHTHAHTRPLDRRTRAHTPKVITLTPDRPGLSDRAKKAGVTIPDRYRRAVIPWKIVDAKAAAGLLESKLPVVDRLMMEEERTQK